MLQGLCFLGNFGLMQTFPSVWSATQIDHCVIQAAKVAEFLNVDAQGFLFCHDMAVALGISPEPFTYSRNFNCADLNQWASALTDIPIDGAAMVVLGIYSFVVLRISGCPYNFWIYDSHGVGISSSRAAGLAGFAGFDETLTFLAEVGSVLGVETGGTTLDVLTKEQITDIGLAISQLHL